MALKRDGTVWTYGKNTSGQLGNNSSNNGGWTWTPSQVLNLTDVTDIEAGYDTGYALKADGTLWGWGNNFYGELGDGTTDNKLVPQKLDISGVRSISAGGHYAIAMKYDGTLWAWGYNANSNLGDGTTTTRYKPTQILSLSGVRAIASGEQHNLALKEDGTVWAWGYNDYGQLGDGTTFTRPLPVQVPGLTNVVAISAGQYTSFALKSDGTVWAWGLNSSGQLGVTTEMNKSVPVKITGLVNLDVRVVATRATSVDLAIVGTDAVARYVVKRGSTVIYDGANTNVMDTGLNSNSMYTYNIEAYDMYDKLLDSRSITVNTNQNDLNVTGIATSDTSVTLTYGTTAAVSYYVVKRNGVSVYSGALTTFDDTGLTTGERDLYTVEAYDLNYHLIGSRSVYVTVSSSNTPPSSSTVTLSAAATATSSSTILLQFAATGGTVSRYVIKRGDTVVFEGQGTTIMDANLTANTQYSYVIEAQDANGTVLASKVLSATTFQAGTTLPGGGTTYPPSGGYYPPTGYYPSGSPLVVVNVPIYLPSLYPTMTQQFSQFPQNSLYQQYPQYQQYQQYPQYQQYQQYPQYSQYQ